jgi:hypothetical protein
MAWQAATMEDKINIQEVLVRKPPGIQPPRTVRRRWKNNIKMDLREISCEDHRQTDSWLKTSANNDTIWY